MESLEVVLTAALLLVAEFAGGRGLGVLGGLVSPLQQVQVVDLLAQYGLHLFVVDLVVRQLLLHPGPEFVVEEFLLLESAHEFDHHVFEVVDDAVGVTAAFLEVLLNIRVDVAEVTDTVDGFHELVDILVPFQDETGLLLGQVVPETG